MGVAELKMTALLLIIRIIVDIQKNYLKTIHTKFKLHTKLIYQDMLLNKFNATLLQWSSKFRCGNSIIETPFRVFFLPDIDLSLNVGLR